MGWSLIIIRDNRAHCFETQIPWTIEWLREPGNTRRAKGPGQKRDLVIFFLAVFLTGLVVLWLWFLCPGTPEGSIGSGSGFKASQKMGSRLKVSSDRLGEAGNQTYDPWFTRHTPICGFPGYKPVLLG